MKFEAYCVKCKEKHAGLKGKPEQSANGTWLVKGQCAVTGGTVVRLLGKNWTPQ